MDSINEIKQTTRGFNYAEFFDLYGAKCSIQRSSLASEPAIWFGCDDPNPLILAKDAKKYNVKCDQNFGWVKYPIPKEVLINTRMHLTREQVACIIPVLQRFVDTGDINE